MEVSVLHMEIVFHMIYKICSRQCWVEAVERGVFAGAEIDLRDGFIHFSTEHQVRETASKHFAGQDDLLLVFVEESKLGKALKWEVSRGGDLFPHLYHELDTASVARVESLPLGPDGLHIFPSLELP